MTYYYNNVYVNNKYSLLASKKFNPTIINNVDKFIDDYYLEEKTIELAESKYQSITINKLLKRCKLKEKDIDLLISGDLQNQILASTLCASDYNISTLGIYSACASFIEGLVIGSMFVSNSNSKVIVCSSSHNLVSEKQFRFPVEYGAIRKRVNTCTASGSISVLLSNEKSNIRVESSTIGKVYKTNHKDTNDMGSAMAYSCTMTLLKHLEETNRNPNYYDLILTGDLGIYGVDIVSKCYKEITNKEIDNILDAGSLFYQDNTIFAGASGPVCLPLLLFDYILKLKKFKKILIIGTGSLHSVSSSNLKIEIPSISHAVSLEVEY